MNVALLKLIEIFWAVNINFINRYSDLIELEKIIEYL